MHTRTNTLFRALLLLGATALVAAAPETPNVLPKRKYYLNTVHFNAFMLSYWLIPALMCLLANTLIS
jgi:hypothetical protein